jgi:hypothetical protein
MAERARANTQQQDVSARAFKILLFSYRRAVATNTQYNDRRLSRQSFELMFKGHLNQRSNISSTL